MSDEARMLIWGYAAFVVLGGLMGLLMAKSRVSFITASIMAIPLALVALKVLPPFVAAAEMAFLGLFFGAKAVARRKLMPGLPMALVSFMALGGLMAMSPEWFPKKTTEPESGTAATSDQGTNPMPETPKTVPTPTSIPTSEPAPVLAPLPQLPAVPATPDIVPAQPSVEPVPLPIPATEPAEQKASFPEDLADEFEPVIEVPSSNAVEQTEEPRPVDEEEDTDAEPDSNDSPDSSLVDPS
jgi:hypothetical protein